MTIARLVNPVIFSRRLLGALLSFLASVFLIHASDPVDPLRLASEVVPVAQSVELTLDPAKDDFSGRTVIDVQAGATFSRFRLHASGLVFSTITLTSEDGVATALTAVVTDAQHGLVTLAAPTPLDPGVYKLAIAFIAKFPRDGYGLYKTVSRSDPYLFSQFADKHARKCFPCWDEPEFKINWQITLRLPAALKAVSNAAVAYETSDGDWQKMWDLHVMSNVYAARAVLRWTPATSAFRAGRLTMPTTPMCSGSAPR